MNRGIIMEIKGRHAMVFSRDCGLVRVPARPDMFVGQAVPLGADKLSAAHTQASRPAVRPFPRRRILSGLAAAVACMILIGTGGLLLNNAVAARTIEVTLSVDVNPSIDLMLNRAHNVVKVQAQNEEAERLLSGVQLEGLGYREAVERWIQTLRQRWEGDLKQVLVSAAFNHPDETFTATLLEMEAIPAASPMAGLDVWVVYSNDRKVVAEAAANGLSIGRQLLLNLADTKQPEMNVAQIASAPLGDMIQSMLRRGQSDLIATPGGNGQTTHSASDPSAIVPSTVRETQRETQRATVMTGEGSTATNRETNRATQGPGGQDSTQATIRNGEQSMTSTGVSTTAGTPTTERITEQSTIRLTDPSATCTPAPSTIHAGDGSGSPSTGPRPMGP